MKYLKKILSVLFAVLLALSFAVPCSASSVWDSLKGAMEKAIADGIDTSDTERNNVVEETEPPDNSSSSEGWESLSTAERVKRTLAGESQKPEEADGSVPTFSEKFGLAAKEISVIDFGYTYGAWLGNFGLLADEPLKKEIGDSVFLVIGDLTLGYDPDTLLITECFAPFYSLNYKMQESDMDYIIALVAAIEYGNPKEYTKSETRYVKEMATDVVAFLIESCANNFDSIMDLKPNRVWTSGSEYEFNYLLLTNVIYLFC